MTDRDTAAALVTMLVGAGATFGYSYLADGKAPNKDNPTPFVVGAVTATLAFFLAQDALRHR